MDSYEEVINDYEQNHEQEEEMRRKRRECSAALRCRSESTPLPPQARLIEWT